MNKVDKLFRDHFSAAARILEYGKASGISAGGIIITTPRSLETHSLLSITGNISDTGKDYLEFSHLSTHINFFLKTHDLTLDEFIDTLNNNRNQFNIEDYTLNSGFSLTDVFNPQRGIIRAAEDILNDDKSEGG